MLQLLLLLLISLELRVELINVRVLLSFLLLRLLLVLTNMLVVRIQGARQMECGILSIELLLLLEWILYLLLLCLVLLLLLWPLRELLHFAHLIKHLLLKNLLIAHRVFLQ